MGRILRAGAGKGKRCAASGTANKLDVQKTIAPGIKNSDNPYNGSPLSNCKSPPSTSNSPAISESYGTGGTPEGRPSTGSNGHVHKLCKVKTKDQLLEHVETQHILTAAEVRRRQREANTKWTQGSHFQAFVGAIIVLNAISLGLETEFGDSQVFVIMEHVFTALFTIELLVRLKVEGFASYFHDRMNSLDFMLVMLSILDVWVLDLLGSQIELRVMSLLRTLRLLRLARLLRLFRIFKELTVIIKSMAASGRALFWAGVFLLICVYMFAIFATSQFGKATDCADDDDKVRLLRILKPSADKGKDDEECNIFSFPTGVGTQESLFGSVEKSMMTLYVCLTEGCGFDVVQPMAMTKPWVVVYFYLFTFVTTFGILNVIVGLFCENIMMAANESERELAQASEDRRLTILWKLKELFVSLDQDGSESISRDEFYRALEEDDQVLTCLEELGLQDEAHLFDILDIDQSGSLSVPEFFEGMMIFIRGNEPARAKDIMVTHLNSQWLRSHLHAVQHESKRSFRRLERLLKEELLRDEKGAVKSAMLSDSGEVDAPVPAERSDSPPPIEKEENPENFSIPIALPLPKSPIKHDSSPRNSPKASQEPPIPFLCVYNSDLPDLSEFNGLNGSVNGAPASTTTSSCPTSCPSKSDDDKFAALQNVIVSLVHKVDAADSRTQGRLDKLEKHIRSVSEQVVEVQRGLKSLTEDRIPSKESTEGITSNASNEGGIDIRSIL